ncbi:MAG: universal stress protein [Planctomycetes bacterium]|nr:universal stress protein [Planctomycetota bacterium]
MKVLLAVDGSTVAEEAAKLFARLPHSEPLDLTVVYINNAASFQGTVVPTEVAEACRNVEQKKGEVACSRILKMFEGANARIEQVIIEGHPGATLVHEAQQRDIDLVVLGATGHSTLERFMLGSTSDFVATHADCSVLVVRPTMLQQLEKHTPRLCVAYDDSDSCKSAVEDFCKVGWVTPMKIDVIHIVPPPYVYSDIPIQIDTSKSRLAAEKMLDHGVTVCKQHGTDVHPHVIEANYTGDGIVQFIKNHQSDLVLLGDTGRGLMGRFLLGSVSRYVLRHASCSVWIGRSKK